MTAPAVIDRVILWMASGLSGSDLSNACVGKLDVDPAAVTGVIAEARRRLTLAAEYNRDELLGTALTRLNDLYGRSIGKQDLAKALAVQKEINRLASLQGSGTSDLGGGEAVEELTAVTKQLHDLALADPAYPPREHVRLAIQRIRELEAQLTQGAVQ